MRLPPRRNTDPAAPSGDSRSTPDKEGARTAALDGFIQHCQTWVQHKVGSLARGTSLTADDREDAQQEILLAVVKALLPSLSGPNPPDSAAARAFVQQIIRKRFTNFVRDHVRSHRRIDDAVNIYRLAEQGLNPGLVLTDGVAGDPARTAAEREEHARLEEALNGLSRADRWPVHQLAADLTQAELAAAWGVSRRTLRRRLARLLIALRSHLANSCP